MPEINIIVRAKDEASAALKNIGGSLDELQNNAQAAVVPLTAIAAAGALIIGKMTMTAARTEELGVVVENLGRVSGYGAEELASVEQSILDLGITTQGARTIMSRFMGAQLDLADASKIARAAQDLAVIGMEDSSVAAENLTYAIASMQPRVLRQYGLFLNLNDVYEKTAAALDKNVEDLTEAEKRQGFLNATLEQATRFEGTYEAAMGTAGKQMRSFRRYTEELSNQLGKFFLPVLTKIVEGATFLIKALIDLPEPVKQVIAAVGGLITVFTGLLAGGAGLIILIPKIAALGGAIAALATGPIGWLALAIMGIGAAVAALYMAWTNNWGGIQDKVRAVWEFLRPVFDAIGAALTWLMTNVVQPLAAVFAEAWGFIAEVVRAAWEGFRPHIEEMKTALRGFWTEIQPRLQEAWATIQAAMEPVAEWIKTTLIPVLEEWWEKLEPVRVLILNLAKAIGSFLGSAAVKALKGFLLGIIVTFDAMAGAIGAVIDAIQDFLGMVRRAIDAWHQFTSVTAGAEPAGPGGGMAPGLQHGLAYVPATMPAVIHRGEAVLTAQQAEVWRSQFNVNVGNVYGMDGFEEQMDNYWWRSGSRR